MFKLADESGTRPLFQELSFGLFLNHYTQNLFFYPSLLMQLFAISFL
jgi:hypothetical protein